MIGQLEKLLMVVNQKKELDRIMSKFYSMIMIMKKPKPQKPKRLNPISLYPLKPEEAIAAFMKINPKKVKKSQTR